MDFAARIRAGWAGSAVAIAAACAGAPPEPPAPAAAPRAATVAARPGESACQAAGRLGVSVAALRAANALREPDDRPLGARPLAVPPRAPLEHRIRSGETLARVAAWYGHSVGDLAQANGLADPDRIVAGADLRIPPGARTGCPPPPMVARAPSPPPVSAGPRRTPAAPRQPAAAGPAAQPAPSAPSPELLARADDQLERASLRYDAADFTAVVAHARSAQDLLAAQPDHPAVVERRARAAWLAGLGHAGLDDRENAAHALREAIALRPELRDDPRLSPRILSLLENGPAEDGGGAVAADSVP